MRPDFVSRLLTLVIDGMFDSSLQGTNDVEE
jgi:hypothetical protein